MKGEELRKKNIGELQQLLYDQLKKQFGLRMQKGMGEMPKLQNFKLIRRDIARIKTIIREKERQ